MDFAESLQSLIPGASGRVLAGLMESPQPLSGRAVARLAGVSPAQAARVLPDLVELGLVETSPAPPAILYSLAQDHVATRHLRALGRLDVTLVEALRKAIVGLDPVPAGAAIYGSFVRGEARADSDIDLLVVRPTTVDEDDDDWWDTVEQIRVRARQLSGNRVEILEVGQSEVRDLFRTTRALWRNIEREAIVLHGPPLAKI